MTFATSTTDHLFVADKVEELAGDFWGAENDATSRKVDARSQSGGGSQDEKLTLAEGSFQQHSFFDGQTGVMEGDADLEGGDESGIELAFVKVLEGGGQLQSGRLALLLVQREVASLLQVGGQQAGDVEAGLFGLALAGAEDEDAVAAQHAFGSEEADVVAVLGQQ